MNHTSELSDNCFKAAVVQVPLCHIKQKVKKFYGGKENLRREKEVINWQINHWKNTSEISLSEEAASGRFYSMWVYLSKELEMTNEERAWLFGCDIAQFPSLRATAWGMRGSLYIILYLIFMWDSINWIYSTMCFLCSFHSLQVNRWMNHSLKLKVQL